MSLLVQCSNKDINTPALFTRQILSKSLTDFKRNDEAYTVELYAVVRVIEHFLLFLQAQRFHDELITPSFKTS